MVDHQKKYLDKTYYRSECNTKLIYNIAIPVILSSASSTLLTTVDTIMVGQYSATALAAVGIAGFIISFFGLAASAFGVGANALIARHIGSEDFKQAGRISKSALFMGVLLGGVIFISISLLSIPLLNFLGTKNVLHDQALSYLNIVKYMFIFTFTNVMIKNIFSANSYTKPLFYITIVVNLTNITLDYLLIYGHFGFSRLGVEGAAYATVFSAFAGLLLGIGIAYYQRIRLNLLVPFSIRENLKLFSGIFKLGLPTMIEWTVWTGSLFFVNKFIITYGTLQVALYHTGMKAQGVLMLFVGGFSTASLTLVSKAYGAKDAGLLYSWNRKILKHTSSFMIIGSFVCFCFPYMILWVFFNQEDLAKINNVRITFMVIGVIILLRGVNIIVGGALRGIGDVKYFFIAQPIGMILLVFFSWLFLVEFKLGVTGAFLAMLIDELFRSVAAMLRFKFKTKLLFDQFSEEKTV